MRRVTPTVQPTRDEADFASHIERTIATDPKAGWIFVADNLTTYVEIWQPQFVGLGLVHLQHEVLDGDGRTLEEVVDLVAVVTAPCVLDLAAA